MAGLLTHGLTYLPRLPNPLIVCLRTSGDLQLSLPITAAGPYRNYTGFPIQPDFPGTTRRFDQIFVSKYRI
jgi:hypothetical protein